MYTVMLPSLLQRAIFVFVEKILPSVDINKTKIPNTNEKKNKREDIIGCSIDPTVRIRVDSKALLPSESQSADGSLKTARLNP